MGSVEQVLFHIWAVKSFKRHNLDAHSVLLAEADLRDAAKKARERVFYWAFHSLRRNHGFSRNRD